MSLYRANTLAYHPRCGHRHHKCNYGRRGAQACLRWLNGILTRFSVGAFITITRRRKMVMMKCSISRFFDHPPRRNTSLALSKPRGDFIIWKFRVALFLRGRQRPRRQQWILCKSPRSQLLFFPFYAPVAITYTEYLAKLPPGKKIFCVAACVPSSDIMSVLCVSLKLILQQFLFMGHEFLPNLVSYALGLKNTVYVFLLKDYLV